MSDDATPDQWKRKYYDSLDDFDKKEKQWARTEELLRRALSRLSLAADGQLPALDQQLVRLRSALRDKASSSLLNQRIEAMSEALMQLDQVRKKTGSSTRGAPAALAKILEDIKLPREHAKQAKQLLGAAAAAPKDAWPEQLIDDTVKLLHAALAENTGHTGGEPAPVNRPGLLSRWLSRPEADAATSGQDGMAGHDILKTFIAALQLPDSQQHRVNALKPRLDQARETAALHQLSRDLAAIWNSAAEQEAPGLDEALLQLLERLNLPGDMTPRVDGLKNRLDNPGTGHDWGETLNDIAELIGDMRTQVQREKREIEVFLQQLTENLQDLDQRVQGSESSRKAAEDNSAALDLAVQDQVRGIESSVQEATELGQLKRTIQARLDAIRTHMENYREDERQRNQETETQVQTLTARMRNLEGETEQLRARISEERAQALQDALTGIPNRLAYEERIAAEYARWKRFRLPLSLMVWDVDLFKNINDTYGHKAGDKVLLTIAETLSGQVRETDFIARYGGEEFVMLAVGAEPAAALELAEKLRNAVQNCGFHFRGSTVPITISCGIAHFGDGDTPERAFERADAALYQAKQQGRNRCVPG